MSQNILNKNLKCYKIINIGYKIKFIQYCANTDKKQTLTQSKHRYTQLTRIANRQIQELKLAQHTCTHKQNTGTHKHIFKRMTTDEVTSST